MRQQGRGDEKQKIKSERRGKARNKVLKDALQEAQGKQKNDGKQGIEKPEKPPKTNECVASLP
ncbi:hypothetical protein SLEP1_g34890 [Rubroshorea leprosula]|uniref:Small EDRK-rich factor-like N-terminal domain-containing protein n=1 Tax=Rubroshorea leprosula TaxID=152421 RepID=A0AAV5KLS8_9ROSI|nr:hypothetical protein SLEP1_g34890 [Rubroshorea leprosula]